MVAKPRLPDVDARRRAGGALDARYGDLPPQEIIARCAEQRFRRRRWARCRPSARIRPCCCT